MEHIFSGIIFKAERCAENFQFLLKSLFLKFPVYIAMLRWPNAFAVVIWDMDKVLKDQQRLKLLRIASCRSWQADSGLAEAR